MVEFIPGSVRTGAVTAANFRAVLAPHHVGPILDTLVLSALTTVGTLLASYPVAWK